MALLVDADAEPCSPAPSRPIRPAYELQLAVDMMNKTLEGIEGIVRTPSLLPCPLLRQHLDMTAVACSSGDAPLLRPFRPRARLGRLIRADHGRIEQDQWRWSRWNTPPVSFGVGSLARFGDKARLHALHQHASASLTSSCYCWWWWLLRRLRCTTTDNHVESPAEVAARVEAAMEHVSEDSEPLNLPPSSSSDSRLRRRSMERISLRIVAFPRSRTRWTWTRLGPSWRDVRPPC